MTCSKWSFAVVPLVFAALLWPGIGTLDARDSGVAPYSVAAAQTARQQCMNACRARYRDCRHLNQLPASQCQGIYQDCTQYSCTGLGPG
jgi:hypothetical protein